MFKPFKNMKWILLSGMILTLLMSMLVQTSNANGLVAQNHSEFDEQTIERDLMTKQNNNKEIEKISHEELAYIMNRFMDILVQEIDENSYEVMHHQTKEELLNEFQEVMARDVADIYVDYYYYEKEDKLYIVPTETPPWFNEHVDYNIVQLNDTQIKVTQENYNDLYGQYKVEYELTYVDVWIITHVTHS